MSPRAQNPEILATFLEDAVDSSEDHLMHLCLRASFQHAFRQAARNAYDAHRFVALFDALRDAVPHCIARKIARLDAATGLSPDPKRATRPPFQPLLLASDASSTLSLLIEILGPRDGAYPQRASPRIRCATQLVWNHCLKDIPLTMMRHAQMFQRPTPASLGEVRDV